MEVYASLDFGSDMTAHVFLHDINIQELEWNILCLVPQIKVNSWVRVILISHVHVEPPTRWNFLLTIHTHLHCLY